MGDWIRSLAPVCAVPRPLLAAQEPRRGPRRRDRALGGFRPTETHAVARLAAPAAPGGATTGRADYAARVTPAAVAGVPGPCGTTAVRRTASHNFFPARWPPPKPELSLAGSAPRRGLHCSAAGSAPETLGAGEDLVAIVCECVFASISVRIERHASVRVAGVPTWRSRPRS